MNRFRLEKGSDFTVIFFQPVEPRTHFVARTDAKQCDLPCPLCEVGVPLREVRPVFQESGGVTYKVVKEESK